MKYIFIFFSIFALFNCIIEDQEEITIEVNKEYLYYSVGTEEGKIGFDSQTQDVNDFFNNSDIQEKTHFNYNITTKEGKTYPLDCRLWKDERKNISILCDFKKQLTKSIRFKIEDTLNVNYYSKKVIINFNIVDCQIKTIEGKIPFLYSSQQDLNIAENQQTIDLKFNFDIYNNEPLHIYQGELLLYLDNCKKADSKILNCQIPKKKLDVIALKENKFGLFFFNINTGYYNELSLVKPINIIYQDIQKEDIHFSLVNLVNKEIGNGGDVTFVTNITNMDKIRTEGFEIILPENINYVCRFIKHGISTPLYMTCFDKGCHNHTIKEIEGFTKDNIHYKYNFVFAKQTINENVTFLKNIRGGIYSIYPETLDFTNKDEYQLFINCELSNIRLNVDADDLNCRERKEVRICSVPKSHFKNKKNGNYLIYYKIKENKYIASYESLGVDVILPSSSGKNINYSLGLFALSYLLILLY